MYLGEKSYLNSDKPDQGIMVRVHWSTTIKEESVYSEKNTLDPWPEAEKS